VFRELRDLSFAAVGPRLGERAKAIQADYRDSKARPRAQPCPPAGRPPRARRASSGPRVLLRTRLPGGTRSGPGDRLRPAASCLSRRACRPAPDSSVRAPEAASACGHQGGRRPPTRNGRLAGSHAHPGRCPAPLPPALDCHCRQLATPGRPRRQAGERSLAELRDFAAALKALPHIQRHIGLAEAVNKVIAAPAFRGRVAVEQALLDGHGTDASAEAIEARPS